ncbi:YkvA family protein [Fonticella tunisiensis]|uniref:Uncharacterized membrane protein YkvA (DUF1232 family) n=1 Tax=Fonticella tunisiensis TaxID=1096341 RepID=A0A4R7KS61_9CLOT|nr:YkvA family protein [Fonticella tunisiensis]TDT62406.1 uncharacterized membrane protein YkvA (DUF1232 family) [Fonticella tunisiensis]
MDLKRVKEWARGLKKNINLLYIAYKHKKTPWYAKALTFIVVAYALSPLDLIPDFIPVLGYLDDLFLIPLGITVSMKLIPEEVIEECREMAERGEGFSDIKSRGVYGVVLIGAVWALIIYLILKRIF